MFFVKHVYKGWKSQLPLHVKNVSFTRIYLREIGICILSKLNTNGYSRCPLNEIKYPETKIDQKKLILQVTIAEYFLKSSVY